jgi:hypothetical protein
MLKWWRDYTVNSLTLDEIENESVPAQRLPIQLASGM